MFIQFVTDWKQSILASTTENEIRKEMVLTYGVKKVTVSAFCRVLIGDILPFSKMSKCKVEQE